MATMPRIQELERQRESDIISDVLPPMVEFVGLVGADLRPQSKTLALGSLRDGRLRVVEPIGVVQMVEEGKCVIEAQELNEFGFGDNFSEAIQDLQEAIAELYFTLELEQEKLGPDLASVWATLSRKVRRADAAGRP